MISVHLCAEGGMYKNIGGLNLFSLQGGEREGSTGKGEGSRIFFGGEGIKNLFF